MAHIRIDFDIDYTAGYEDTIVARVDAIFPVFETNMAAGSITVDASSDPNEYSVLMAAVEAIESLELDSEAAVEGTERIN